MDWIARIRDGDGVSKRMDGYRAGRWKRRGEERKGNEKKKRKKKKKRSKNE
jgi:hypothetical protein